MKITAIMGGGDWADASVQFVVLPEGKDIKSLHVEYDEWLKGYRLALERSEFYTFPEWLKEFAGATVPPDDQLEVVWEEDL